MKDLQNIIKELTRIYKNSGRDAEEYLAKARKLERSFGSGPAIVYCWFYSVPQKWTHVEAKIFELMKLTDSFDLDIMLAMPREELARAMMPMIFHNEISNQLKKFCKAVEDEYGSWDAFAKIIKDQDIFSIFSDLRRYKGIRLTLKNLAAMKSFVGQSDNFPILDTHLANFLGISKETRNRFIVQEALFKKLLFFSSKITQTLRKEGFKNMTAIQWSLAIWFNRAKICAKDLLYIIS